MVLSKSALQAPIFMATANPCGISTALSSNKWQPTIFSSAPTVTSFIRGCLMSDRACCDMGLKLEL